MVINSSVGGLAEFKEELPTYQTENDPKASNGKYAVLEVSTSRKALLSDDKLSLGKQNALKAIPGRLNILNFSSNGGLSSPSTKFKQMTEERDEISRSVPSPSTSQGYQKHFNRFTAQKIDWESLWSICRNWIKNPFNMVLFLWISCVAVSGAILFLVMTGILDAALPKKSQRDAWFEVNNQILNALFTLMCLYQHPKRFYHLVLLCRWRSKDITKLRRIYCKNGTYKPHEWAHMILSSTFLLFCTAPFWIFNLAAVNIDNETVRVALGLTGIALCLFGLLYGGFWRIQMRKRFSLPASNIFIGKPTIADCAQWLFCCWCSLAQEVRTADFYDIVEDKFCRKQTNESYHPTLPSLPREDGVVQFMSSPNSLHNSHRLLGLGAKRSPSPSRLSRDHYSPGRQLSKVEEDFSMKDTDDFMKPPALALIQREGTAQNILMENNHL